MKAQTSPNVSIQDDRIQFFLKSDGLAHMSVDGAAKISLSGSFNSWAQDVLIMKPNGGDGWKIEIPMLPQGKYLYKFLIDGRMWMEDVDNPNREPDGFNGFNSVLFIG